MLRIIRMVIVTCILCIRYGNKIEIRGLLDMSINSKVLVHKEGHITFGNRVAASNNVLISSVKGELVIGDRTSFNRNCMIVSREKISIGKNCAFGPNVVVYDHDHFYDEVGFKKGEYTTSPISIGDNCWIGANTVILKGTIIGDGSVIGAGTIVKGSIPEHSVVKSNREVVTMSIKADADDYK